MPGSQGEGSEHIPSHSCQSDNMRGMIPGALRGGVHGLNMDGMDSSGYMEEIKKEKVEMGIVQHGYSGGGRSQDMTASFGLSSGSQMWPPQAYHSGQAANQAAPMYSGQVDRCPSYCFLACVCLLLLVGWVSVFV